MLSTLDNVPDSQDVNTKLLKQLIRIDIDEQHSVNYNRWTKLVKKNAN